MATVGAHSDLSIEKEFSFVLNSYNGPRPYKMLYVGDSLIFIMPIRPTQYKRFVIELVISGVARN